MQIGAMTLTALAGATLAVQVGLNATMRGHAGSPMAAALINFAVGTVFLAAAVLLGRGPVSALAGVSAAPWWAWGAGILGGLYIAASAAFGPLIGGATFLALIVAGQMVAAPASEQFVIDHPPSIATTHPPPASVCASGRTKHPAQPAPTLNPGSVVTAAPNPPSTGSSEAPTQYGPASSASTNAAS